MTLNRYAKRRDANEPEILTAAERCGLRVWRMSELGDAIVQRGRVTRIWEVKTDDGKLTEAQAKRKQAGLITHIVRTVDDVLEQRRQMDGELVRLAGGGKA